MPIYEYECGRCKRTLSFLVRNIGAHEAPKCPKCGAGDMSRVFSRFATVGPSKSKSSSDTAGGGPPDLADEGGPEGMPDLEGLEGLDEGDPRSLARFLRKMENESGEKMDPEMDSVCRRLEKGEDPESIEEDLGDALGGEGGEGSDDTLYDA